MTSLPSIDAAFAACCASRGAGADLQKLRELLELSLIARLSILSSDSSAVHAAIDCAFEALIYKCIELQSLNWQSWLVSTALADLAERLGKTSWLDRLLPSAFSGSLLDRRAALIGVVLTLGGTCQWRLLKCIAGGWLDHWQARSCLSELTKRVNDIG